MDRQEIYFAKWILNTKKQKSRIFSTEDYVFVIVKIGARNTVLEIANRSGPIEPNGAAKILALGRGGVNKKIGAVLDPNLDACFLESCHIDGIRK